MKNILTLIFCLFVSFNAFGQGSISGLVTDKDTGEPILFGDIVVYQDGKLITGEQTDFDGNYRIDSIKAGIYDIHFKYVGYEDTKFSAIKIVDGRETGVRALISPKKRGLMTGCGGYGGYKIPLMGLDIFEKGQSFTSKEIQRMPIKN